jgi:hypothetical protein
LGITITRSRKGTQVYLFPFAFLWLPVGGTSCCLTVRRHDDVSDWGWGS